MDLSNIQKPFLKWAGGKTQILDKILGYFPHKMNNYHEIFLGGGSVLLAVLSLQKQGHLQIQGNIYAYDVNPALINVYQQIHIVCFCMFSVPNTKLLIVNCVWEHYW